MRILTLRVCYLSVVVVVAVDVGFVVALVVVVAVVGFVNRQDNEDGIVNSYEQSVFEEILSSLSSKQSLVQDHLDGML